MVFDGNLDTGQVKAIYQLLKQKVPVVRAETIEGDSISTDEILLEDSSGSE
jgi:hypothetical protein